MHTRAPPLQASSALHCTVHDCSAVDVDGSWRGLQRHVPETQRAPAGQPSGHWPRTLGSLSSFMKHLKPPITRMANREDGWDGHFRAQRFCTRGRC